jgi:hypothetical protein
VKVGNWKLGGGALANSVITAKFSSSSLGKVISLDKNGESIVLYTSRAAAQVYAGEGKTWKAVWSRRRTAGRVGQIVDEGYFDYAVARG